MRAARCWELAVEILRSLADDLDALTEALDDPVLDLEAVLSVLTDDLTSTIPSYLGLSITLNVDGNALTLSSAAPSPGRAARSSLWLPLVPGGAEGSGGHVVFYAREADAFIDLADDASWMFTRHGHAVVDRHLLSADAMSGDGIAGFGEFRDINQAVGILTAMGHSPARAELDRRAIRGGRTVLQTAREVLSAAPGEWVGDG